ncbi:MAG: hypothetical protein WC700_17080 [Gemmatimonadaceae bacterium]|jgi:hypothetical protein
MKTKPKNHPPGYPNRIEIHGTGNSQYNELMRITGRKGPRHVVYAASPSHGRRQGSFVDPRDGDQVVADLVEYIVGELFRNPTEDGT